MTAGGNFDPRIFYVIPDSIGNPVNYAILSKRHDLWIPLEFILT